MVRSTWCRTLAVLALLAVAAACTPRDAVVGMCREPDRPTLVVDDDHTVPWPSPSSFIANGTTIEAGGQAWIHDDPSSTGHRVGIKFHRPAVGGSQRMDLCFVGGAVGTTLHAEATPWSTWHDTYGFVQENPDATVVGLRLFNTGDGIMFNHRADRWRVIGVRADGMGVFAGAYIHDDCVENDSMFNGLILDAKFDGCHVFLSSDAGEILVNPPDGTGRTVQIERTLVRLQGYDQSYDVATNGTGRHGGFFKFSDRPERGTPPQVVIRHSTLRSDERGAYGGNRNGTMGLPPGSICEDVMVIGAATWTASERRSWVDQCDGLTFGTVADWDARVAQWDEDHPDL